MNSRILGIIGAVLVLIGIFLPLASITLFGETHGLTYFDGLRSGDTEGIIVSVLLILLGIASIALAALGKSRSLIITGVLTLGVLIFTYIRIKSSMSEGIAEAERAGGAQAATMASEAFSMSWGWIVLALGGLALIIAGILKDKTPTPAMNWGAPPPPSPPPYPPAR
ncbi:MAG TPA: hypothetical protein VGN95_24945 [Pyrinomonadaceae bacterium]|jgi:hypothetical protein|nr:hypothetical protein [Pyrinomonadaceae bacterium]